MMKRLQDQAINLRRHVAITHAKYMGPVSNKPKLGDQVFLLAGDQVHYLSRPRSGVFRL